MPKNFIKRYLPDPKKFKEHKHLKIFGDLLHDANLWHLNRHSVARAFSVGLFSAFMPIPFQMVLSAALAMVFRANLALSVVLVWITNPITMPPILYYSYKLGAKILQLPEQNIPMSFTWEWIASQFTRVWEPLLLGSIILGVSSALFANLLLRIIWRIKVIHSFKVRKLRYRGFKPFSFKHKKNKTK